MFSTSASISTMPSTVNGQEEADRLYALRLQEEEEAYRSVDPEPQPPLSPQSTSTSQPASLSTMKYTRVIPPSKIGNRSALRDLHVEETRNLEIQYAVSASLKKNPPMLFTGGQDPDRNYAWRLQARECEEAGEFGHIDEKDSTTCLAQQQTVCERIDYYSISYYTKKTHFITVYVRYQHSYVLSKLSFSLLAWGSMEV
jgi:hypothetical protein